MKRNFLVFVFLTAAFFYGWDRGVTRGGIGRYIETHPTTTAGDRVLFVLGSFHELVNQDKKALDQYQRVVTLYPESRFGDAAQFGVAGSYERLHQKDKALVEYEKYKKKYPQGRFIVSVTRNLDYLKGY